MPAYRADQKDANLLSQRLLNGDLRAVNDGSTNGAMLEELARTLRPGG